jgi:3'5'-cyclic nucleotide phosphodiesterase
MALLFFTDASVSKDHPGVPNAQVIKESTSLASKYKGKSCAEQHSIDVAWSTLLEPEYRELRNTICGTPVEVMRFRQLVVNLVMATDGMYALSWFPISCTWRQSHPSRISVVIDKDLKALRDDRWNMAFPRSTMIHTPMTTLTERPPSSSSTPSKPAISAILVSWRLQLSYSAANHDRNSAALACLPSMERTALRRNVHCTCFGQGANGSKQFLVR